MYILGCSLIYLDFQFELFTLQLLRLLTDFIASAGFTGHAAAGTWREGEYNVKIFSEESNLVNVTTPLGCC